MKYSLAIGSCFTALTLLVITTSVKAKEYPLYLAIEEAQQNDPWLQRGLFQQQSLHTQSVSAGSLPDPTVSLGIANLPVESFDFVQEAMTQFEVGILLTQAQRENLNERKYQK